MKTKKNPSSCKESVFRKDCERGQYSNCDDTANAIYIHTTGIPKDGDTCCQETGLRLMQENAKYAKGISDFIGEINSSVTVDSMCYVRMEGSESFHMFTLEFRVENEPKGFYVFTSWSNFFSLHWFLGLDNDMRSKMTTLPEEYASIYPAVDPSAKNLRTKCGLEKFVKFVELRECLNLFALVLKNVVDNPLSELEFDFSCRELNDDFKTKY